MRDCTVLKLPLRETGPIIVGQAATVKNKIGKHQSPTLTVPGPLYILHPMENVTDLKEKEH